LETSKELKEINRVSNRNQIQLIEGKFGSPGATRNVGLSLIEHEWVSFWDSDDLPQIENVMKAISNVRGSDLDCIVGNFRVVEINTKKHKVKTLSKNYMDDIGLNPGIWRFIFSSSSLGSNSFVNLSMAEDQVFLAHYFSTSRKVKLSPDLFYDYFVGLSSQLTRNKKALSDLPIAMKMVYEVFRSDTGNQRINPILLTRIFLTALKMGDIPCKIYALRTWLTVFAVSKLRMKQSLIQALWIVLKNV
jgi:glycosyltransferase involved in cell wall biosynthesis